MYIKPLWQYFKTQFQLEPAKKFVGEERVLYVQKKEKVNWAKTKNEKKAIL